MSLPLRELENDIGAIRAFAELAEELGYTHLRVPDQIIRPVSGHLHEPLTLLAYIAAVTRRIELVPSVIVLPVRQTALFAKQAAELDILSQGRLRLGIGVGGNEHEYAAMGQDFHTRGARCDEQLTLLRRLWCEPQVDFDGTWDQIAGAGLDPLPVQRPIPVWIGAVSDPSASVVRRIGAQSDGWFVLATPEAYPDINARIAAAASAAGRDPASIGAEAGVAVVGPREAEWRDRVRGWRRIGLSHLCVRTLGGGLTGVGHLEKLREITPQIPQDD
ncbi:MAG: TIGR03619 family F420-dependent LLM class oxidoreductase [Gammaproteobacteria bacterium]